MWGIIPAAGNGTRIQPLAFSKELLPVGSRSEDGVERPRAVSEYLIERMLAAGADKLCFVISPNKADILRYYGAQIGSAAIAYTVQPRPAGLCDALFRAAPLIDPAESVLIGLPDTIWYPEDGFTALAHDGLCFLLFPVERPELFDAVAVDSRGRVERIWVKSRDAGSHWIWGAMRMPGSRPARAAPAVVQRATGATSIWAPSSTPGWPVAERPAACAPARPMSMSAH